MTSSGKRLCWKSSLLRKVAPQEIGLEQGADPATASSILPHNVYAQLVRDQVPRGDVHGESVAVSYDRAVKACEEKVAQIVAECRRNNLRYSDPHFELTIGDLDTLRGLSGPFRSATADGGFGDEVGDAIYQIVQDGQVWGSIKPIDQGATDDQPSGNLPKSVKRVTDMFEKPQFIQDGVNASDVRQGAEGDCWFLASLVSLCTQAKSSHLIERICPPKARDEQVGVYGFVFFRDGEWISEVIDDKLFLSNADYDDMVGADRQVWDANHRHISSQLSQELYRKQQQTGSDALFYASCADQNETWVPLIEKAFAKAHGDYSAVNGGWPGEGIEDLSGGISTEMITADILDKTILWEDGLMKVNQDFLFGGATLQYDAPDPNMAGRQGIEDGHAYSVLKATEYKGTRLLLVKNPWGTVEWNGPWSDGSKEWTADALTTLGHSFGDDGIFWMTYEDFLRRYYAIWRTRLFTPEWTVTTKWTTLSVPWAGGVNDTSFEIEIVKPGVTVVILSQLDNRYFQGLTGQYTFTLAFRLHACSNSAYIMRSKTTGDRSATAEIDLAVGTYDVFVQISADRDSSAPRVEEVVKQNWLNRREKLLRTGLSYDLAQAKGQIDNTEDMKQHAEGRSSKSSKAVAGSEEDSKDLVPAATSGEEEALQAEPANEAQAEPSTTVSDPTASQPPGSFLSVQPLPSQSQSAPKISPPGGSADAVNEAGVEGEVYADPGPSDTTNPPVDASTSQETEDEPWGVTSVVGLRVYCRDSAATIRVIRPKKKQQDQEAGNTASGDAKEPASANLNEVGTKDTGDTGGSQEVEKRDESQIAGKAGDKNADGGNVQKDEEGDEVETRPAELDVDDPEKDLVKGHPAQAAGKASKAG